MLAAESCGATHICIFIRRSILEEHAAVTGVRSDWVATGEMAKVTVANKGAAAICLRLCGVSLVFVTAHLPAHATPDGLRNRNRDYHRIDSELRCENSGRNSCQNAHAVSCSRIVQMSSPAPRRARIDCNSVPVIGNSGCFASCSGERCGAAPRGRLTDRFDGVFWMGDLNYRINGTRAVVDQLLERKDMAVLRSNEELVSASSLWPTSFRLQGHGQVYRVSSNLSSSLFGARSG
jgi:hypothetical protein